MTLAIILKTLAIISSLLVIAFSVYVATRENAAGRSNYVSIIILGVTTSYVIANVLHDISGVVIDPTVSVILRFIFIDSNLVHMIILYERMCAASRYAGQERRTVLTLSEK